MSLAKEDVSAIAAALQTLIVQPTSSSVSAVTLKLPTFWTAKPEIWFKQVESQFATRQITTDQTKYDYVVSALDNSTAAEVEALILNPPKQGRYEILKNSLINAFGKTQAAKDAELLSLSGLGDRKPTGLLRHIRSLNADPETLLRAVFLAQLPADVRRVLAGMDIKDLDELAQAADRVLEAAKLEDVVNAVSSPRQPTLATTSSESTTCYYHTRFGQAARKCGRKSCPLSHLLQTTNQGNAKAGR